MEAPAAGGRLPLVVGGSERRGRRSLWGDVVGTRAVRGLVSVVHITLTTTKTAKNITFSCLISVLGEGFDEGLFTTQERACCML